MTVDSVIAPELLNAEIAAIEDLLVHYEDWRALAQLEARERKGELPASVASSGIKTLLLDKLATNPLFLRRQTLLKEVERLTKQARVEAAMSETDLAGEPAEDVDDLTRIRGIDARLERRLNALNITSYAQIAIWEEADVDYFARTLGLDESIIGEKWIEQAAVLVARQKLAPRKSASSPITRPSVALPQTPRPITTPMDDEAIEDAATPAEPQSRGAPRDRAASLDLARGGPTPAARPPKNAVEEPQPSPAESVREGRSVHAAAPGPVTPANVAKTGLPSAQSAPEKLAPAKPQLEPTKPQTRPEPENKAAPAKPDAVDAAPAAPEPDYPLVPPAMPLRASAYVLPFEAYLRESEIVAKAGANDTAKDTAPIRGADEIADGGLNPTGPLPASRYAGAAYEPPRGAVHLEAQLPPKPQAVSAYASPPAQASAAAQGDIGQPQSAGDILERSLPPLPFEPANTGSAPERAQSAQAKTVPPLQDAAPSPRDPSPLKTPPADAASATTAAIAAAQAAVAARSAPIPVKSAPPQQLAPDGAVAATATGKSGEGDLTAQDKSLDLTASPARPTFSPAPKAATAPAVPTEAGLLAAAAARGLVEAAPPPPLPPSTPAQPAQLAQQAARRTIQVEEKSPPAHQSAAEARVTIRRTEEVATNAVLRVPGGTDVHLRTPPRHDEEKFDGRSYAAYHSEVQEARVEIRRTPPPGSVPVPVRGAGDFSYGGMPPAAEGSAALDAATRAAVEAAARAAAALTNAQNVAAPQPPPSSAASEPAPSSPPGQPAEEPPKPPVTMGRFLKALTGQ